MTAGMKVGLCLMAVTSVAWVGVRIAHGTQKPDYKLVIYDDERLKGRSHIVREKVADLKGEDSPAQVKHLITDGFHPREPKVVIDWAEPGKTAVCFQTDKVCLICIGSYWYECGARESPCGLSRQQRRRGPASP